MADFRCGVAFVKLRLVIIVVCMLFACQKSFPSLVTGTAKARAEATARIGGGGRTAGVTAASTTARTTAATSPTVTAGTMGATSTYGND